MRFFFLALALTVSSFAIAAPGQGKLRATVILTKPEPLGDPTPSIPPLETDSAYPTLPHELDASIIGSCDNVNGGGRCDAGLMLDYGITKKLDVYFYRAYERIREDENTVYHGMTPSEVGAKFQVYDKHGLAIAIAPAFQMNDGMKATGEDEGKTVYLPIIVSKELAHWTLSGNVGYTKTLNHGDDTVFVGAAAGRTVGHTSTVMGEVTTENGVGYHRTDFRIGWVKVIFPREKSRYQTSVFVSAGHSLSSNDGLAHKMIRVGLNVSLLPRQR